MNKWLMIGFFVLLVISVAPMARGQTSSAVYSTTVTYNVQNIGSNSALNVKSTIYLFGKVSGWGNQEVISESITADGKKVTPQIIETPDNRWTQINLGNLSPGETKVIKVDQVLKVSAVDLNINTSNVGSSIPSELMVYTQPVAGLYESDDSAIQALAKQFSGTSNLYDRARQIFGLVLESPDNKQHLTYQVQPVEHSALWGLQNKVGDCTEFSNLLVALLRAAGIPAKGVAGYAYNTLYNLTGTTTDINALGHAYVIFYLPNYGWVPADALWPSYIGSFGEMDQAHIVGASTDGVGVVKNEISWPGPVKISSNWQIHTGQNTNLGYTSSGTITPEILMDVSLQPESQIKDGTLGITVTIKNMGHSEAKDLVAQLKPDNRYFEVVTGPQSKSNLASQNQWVTHFNLKVKEGAYGTTQTLVSEVTFSSSDGSISGSFLSTGSKQLPIAIKTTITSPSTTITLDNTMLYAVVGGIAVVVVALAVVMLKRRK